MAIDRRLLFNVDWGLLAAVVLLAAIGVAMILSATSGSRFAGAHVKQIYGVLLGLVGLLLCLVIDYRQLADRSPILLIGISAVLAYVLLFGPRIAYTHRWLVLGPFQVQPSELAKPVAVLFAAKAFAESKKDSLGLADVVGPALALGLLALLIAPEPDLGTAFCMVPLFLTVAFLAGLRMKAVLLVVVALIVGGVLSWQYALSPRQKTRIYTFLDPERDPKGAGYQTEQSQIAVGSGELRGKGYRKGTQSQYGYLPARHTDFIFSVLAEEMGFFGVITVLGLYLFVLWRFLETAQLARDRVGGFVAAGVASIFAFQVVYNVAMAGGLVPVKGLPLPLMSYGGSSVLSTLLQVGLVLNVRMRRFAN